MSKEVVFGVEARGKLLRGVDALADVVRGTLGPGGRSGVDTEGVEVADGFENVGVQMVREAAARTKHVAGGGSATTVVLAQAIAAAGVRAVAEGVNPLDLKRGFDEAVDEASKVLCANSRKISSLEEIAQVGTVLADGERRIGWDVAEAMQWVGTDGVIMVEGGLDAEEEIEVVEGMRFDGDCLSVCFVTNSEEIACELENPYVLLYDGEVSSLRVLESVFKAVAQANRCLLVVADDIEGGRLAALVVNEMWAELKVVGVRMQGFGGCKTHLLEDVAVMTGAKVVSEAVGLKLEDVTLDGLGRARRVVVSKESIVIVGGDDCRQDVRSRIVQIRAQWSGASSEEEKVKLCERLARLSVSVAVLKVGGSTKAEVKERKARVEGVLNATRDAVREGVVAGGGVALLRASRGLLVEVANDGERAGIEIVRRALDVLAKQIVMNAGGDAALVVGRILEDDCVSYGYDVQTWQYGDMMAMGVVDPLNVVRTALQVAASGAGMLIATEVVIVEASVKGELTPQQEQL
ncbi:MAG: chaperonin GroEL [Candidatus Hodgkinia cicadicola]